ncbi:MAG TPA: energy transducer TonB [Acidobacteriaceae bacterium]|nr:energy transducer TonB [Acidobacteriaceae bacterium]
MSFVTLGLLCCTGSVLGQSGGPRIVTLDPSAFLGDDASSRPLSAIILSDTQGVDFAPYMRESLSMVRKLWASSLPEGVTLNSSETVIRFTIKPDGRISAMVLLDASHQIAIDRAAWSSITGVGQFPPLPADFNGPGLTLNIHFKVKPSQQ